MAAPPQAASAAWLARTPSAMVAARVARKEASTPDGDILEDVANHGGAGLTTAQARGDGQAEEPGGGERVEVCARGRGGAGGGDKGIGRHGR